jgi:hypothetical protein
MHCDRGHGACARRDGAGSTSTPADFANCSGSMPEFEGNTVFVGPPVVPEYVTVAPAFFAAIERFAETGAPVPIGEMATGTLKL